MIDTGSLPVSGVTGEELADRARRLGLLLKQKEVPLAIVGYNPDLYYFTGSIQQGYALITQEGETSYLVRKDVDRARVESPLGRIEAFSRFREIKNAVKRLAGKVPAKLALTLDVIPAALYLRFRDLFQGCEIADGSALVRSCRMIKSPFEVDRIRKGIEIYDETVRQMPRLVRAGMTEAEAEAALIHVMRRLGHPGMVRMRGWNQEGINGYLYAGESAAVPSFLDAPLGGVGLTPAIPIGGGVRKIERDIPLIFDASPGDGGYVSDQTRTAVIGTLPPDLTEAYHLTVEMIQRFEAEATPGDAVGDWFVRLEKMADRAGLVEYFMGVREKRVRYIGHGIGLELNEWPVLGENLPWRLEPGMVLAIEPKMVFPGKGAVGLENDYLVTETGVTRLSVTGDGVVLFNGTGGA